MRSFGWFIALAALILLPASSHAADVGTASSERPIRLATWLDDDVGLCLELDNLAEQWGKFRESRLHEGIVHFPPIADWLSQHRQELSFLKQEIERRTGISARDVGTKLLGRQVVFAIWPPTNPLTGKPTALLLAESTDGDLMRRSLAKLVAARHEAGRWRGRRVMEAGDDSVTVDIVVPDDEQSEFFIAPVDNIAVIASDEALMRKVLARHAANDSTGSFAASPRYLEAARKRSADAVRVFINPRAWDAALAADLKRKPPDSDEAKSQAVIVGAWKAIDYVCGGARITPELGVDLVCKWRADELPDPVREAAASLEGRSAFLDHLADSSLIAWAGHVDLARLVRYSIDRSWREKKGGGKNLQDTIIPWALLTGLGPDFGGYVTVSDMQGSPTSVDVVVGLQTRPLEPGRDRPPFAESFEPVLHALLSAAVESVNRQSGASLATIRTTIRDGRRITTATGILRDRARQALSYCVDTTGWLWLGTSPAAVENALSGNRPSVGPCISELIDFGSFVSLNLAELRRLTAKGPQVLQFLWDGKEHDAKVKEQQYQSLLALSKLGDRLTLAAGVGASSAHLHFVLEADEE